MEALTQNCQGWSFIDLFVPGNTGSSAHTPWPRSWNYQSLKSLLEFVLPMTQFPCLFWVTVQTIQSQNMFSEGNKSNLWHHTFPVSFITSNLSPLRLSELGRLPRGQVFPVISYVCAPVRAQPCDAANFLLARTNSRLFTTNRTSQSPLTTSNNLVFNVWVGGDISLGQFFMTQAV